MRPCSRCRRILGLPPVVKDYPEPLIENGIFPADYAGMYRDMLGQLTDGRKEAEAEIPLTQDRLPYMVRYTVESNENGKPVRAYGSATRVKRRSNEHS